MSQWSEDAAFTAKRYKPSHLPDNLRLKDKEDLIEELMALKQENNLQSEEIKLLKTEIAKLKRT